MDQPRRNPKRGPESRFYDKHKGKTVFLEKTGKEPERVRLIWVDRYSIGIVRDDGKESLVQKSDISEISEV